MTKRPSSGHRSRRTWGRRKIADTPSDLADEGRKPEPEPRQDQKGEGRAGDTPG